MSREVCGHEYDEGDVFICGMAKSFGDHDPDVPREFGGHEYEPVLAVPLPLNLDAAKPRLLSWKAVALLLDVALVPVRVVCWGFAKIDERLVARLDRWIRSVFRGAG